MTYQNGNLPQGDFCLTIVDTLGCTLGQGCFTVSAPEILEVDTEISLAFLDRSLEEIKRKFLRDRESVLTDLT